MILFKFNLFLVLLNDDEWNLIFEQLDQKLIISSILPANAWTGGVV